MVHVDMLLHGVLDSADVLTHLAPWFYALSRIIFADAIREDSAHVRVVLKADAPVQSFLQYYRDFSASSLVNGPCTVTIGAVTGAPAHQQPQQHRQQSAKDSREREPKRPTPLRAGSKAQAGGTEGAGMRHTQESQHQEQPDMEHVRVPSAEALAHTPHPHQKQQQPQTQQRRTWGSGGGGGGGGGDGLVIDQQHRLLQRESPFAPGAERCPICLELLWDDRQCVATTFCEHSFHAECLRKYVDATCPVCRKTQVMFDDQPRCLQCHATKNLWMCLNCGFVGCGRRQWDGADPNAAAQSRQHALEHYLQTSHALVRQLDTGRVWDYKQDSYVGSTDAVQSSEAADVVDPRAAEKQESLQLEYSLLIAQQLEEQRALLQQRLGDTQRMVDEQLGSLRRRVESLQKEHDETVSSLSATTATLKAHAERKSKLQRDIERVRAMQREEEEFLSSLRTALEPRATAVQSPSDRAKQTKRRQLEATLARLAAQRDELMQKLT
ncbi:hypothetical protein PTSG_03094 [Salpingoeca rosetta]|uniref:RING-type domain-containing protein n=1 Tax=Salpingoeca rosetta (strain ATCC 50818 / BSB-021) TaxID=946362 RepID=F2U481_SALR5|nr:uncharacterized protein PTSG_03094 [Salpingoeca rosetta]EGD82447.1 hypothetical protein PTSG_03094 [Salpingoeca rosetta]|eukprot:XP_004995683.1 hypothetical protein PTSG_03094 [Salpingoeca rosetta]